MATHHLEKIAPTHVHAPSHSPGEDMATSEDGSFRFTVGKLDAGMAILIGDRASLIEFPSLLLPAGVTSGSVVNIRVNRNEKEEQRQHDEFVELQEAILDTFGKEAPKAPALRLRNVTQTSVTLEWDRLSLATATLMSLDIYRNGQRLAPIPNPLHNTSTKLSGLGVDAEYSFHLVLKTTAGTFSSPIIKTRTHTMTDTSGISVCFGHIDDPSIDAAAREVLEKMKARSSEKIQIETTHFVCSDPRTRGDANALHGSSGAMYNKAAQLSIPIVQPHWVFACYEQKRMVPISSYYLDVDPPNASTLRESVLRVQNGGVSKIDQEPAAIGSAFPDDARPQENGSTVSSIASPPAVLQEAEVVPPAPRKEESRAPTPAAKDTPPIVMSQAPPVFPSGEPTSEQHDTALDGPDSSITTGKAGGDELKAGAISAEGSMDDVSLGGDVLADQEIDLS